MKGKKQKKVKDIRVNVKFAFFKIYFDNSSPMKKEDLLFGSITRNRDFET